MPEEKAVAKLRHKYIKYVGLSDVRVIRPQDWKSIGVEAEEVRWSSGNDFRILADDLPEEVLEYCQHDRELVIVEE